MPSTIFTQNINEIKNFFKKHKKIIIKPIHSFGGNDIHLLSSFELKLINKFIKKHNYIMCQKYLSKINKGDKRVFLINGKVCGAISRIPKKGSFLSNLSKGAKAVTVKLTNKEIKISKLIAKQLKKEKIFFAGIDFIDQKLNGDVNVTSPTGLKTLYDLSEINLAKTFLERTQSMKNLTDQQKGSLMAFVAVMFITPDSLFIRLSNVDTWGLVFYRGIIPFITVFLGMLLIYKLSFFKILFNSGYHGLIYIGTFSITNITFVVSIQNTNVANTLVMIATAPMLSAILGAIFLKEPPDKKTWISIIITFLAVLYIFFDSLKLGNFFGDILGFITAVGLAVGAVTIRSAKSKNLVPAAVVGKLIVAIFALFFIESFVLIDRDLLIIPLMCIMCVAIPFVLVTIAPRFIPAAEVNLFFLLETIIGPIWVWLIIKEQPSIETLYGGAIIITTIAIHSFLKLKKS